MEVDSPIREDSLNQSKRRENIVDISKMIIYGLNAYEISLLFALQDRRRSGNVDVVLTKIGSVWPIIFTELAKNFILENKDVSRATKIYLEKFNTIDWNELDPFEVATKELDLFHAFLRQILNKQDFDFFIENILGKELDFEIKSDWQLFLTLINARYKVAVRSLIKHDIIEDPLVLDPVGLLILGFVPFKWNKVTKNGEEIYKQINALFWEYERKGQEDNKEITFNFRLISLIRKFIEGLVKNYKDM